AAPFGHGGEDGKEVATRLGQHVFVARRPLAVTALLQYAGLGQGLQSPGQDVRRDAETRPELVELGHAQARVPKDQRAPGIAHMGQAAGDGAGTRRKFVDVHCIMIATSLSYGNEVTIVLQSTHTESTTMNTQVKGKALITGASSGIGEIYAERLAD